MWMARRAFISKLYVSITWVIRWFDNQSDHLPKVFMGKMIHLSVVSNILNIRENIMCDSRMIIPEPPVFQMFPAFARKVMAIH